MFKSKIVHNKLVYEIDEVTCKKLLERADKIIVNAFPKTSPNKFAAAVLTKKGNIYEGISYGSDTATLTMHSEATALAHAAVHRETEIIAITGPNCHICKQLIYENSLRSGIDIVVVFEENRKIKQIPISAMMPYPWPDKPVK